MINDITKRLENEKQMREEMDKRTKVLLDRIEELSEPRCILS